MAEQTSGPGPRPEWVDACCVICPAQRLSEGEFDVVDRPATRYAFNEVAGCRVDLVTGVPVCVHPFRVGLEPGPYASAAAGWADGALLPDPDDPADRVSRRGRRPQRPAAVFTPSPEQLVLPESADDLEGWLIAMLRSAPDSAMASALGQAEAIASRRFAGEQVVAAMRRVLSHGLPSQ